MNLVAKQHAKPNQMPFNLVNAMGELIQHGEAKSNASMTTTLTKQSNLHLPRLMLALLLKSPTLELALAPTLSLRLLSTLLRTLALLLLRLNRLISVGSHGCKPDALANKFNISVKLTTPDKRPLSVAPGIADAEMVVWAVGGGIPGLGNSMC